MMEIRTRQCLEMLAEMASIDGDLIELGVGPGMTTIPLAQEMVKRFGSSKRLYACDTFSGMPFDDEIAIPESCKKGELCYPDEIILEKMRESNLTEAIVLIKGKVEDTLYSQLKAIRFCFAWVDLDLFQSTSYAYEFLEERIVPGGLIGFHDYGFSRCPGIKKVVDEQVNRGLFEEFRRFPDGSIFFRRKTQ